MENYRNKERNLERIGARNNYATRKQAHQAAQRACAFGYNPVLHTEGRNWHYHPIKYVAIDGKMTNKPIMSHDHYNFWKKR